MEKKQVKLRRYQAKVKTCEISIVMAEIFCLEEEDQSVVLSRAMCGWGGDEKAV